MHLLADIMRKQGITNRPEDLAADREKIMKALTATKGWPGVAGKLGFNEDGDGVKDIYVFTVRGRKVGEAGVMADRRRIQPVCSWSLRTRELCD